MFGCRDRSQQVLGTSCPVSASDEQNPSAIGGNAGVRRQMLFEGCSQSLVKSLVSAAKHLALAGNYREYLALAGIRSPG